MLWLMLLLLLLLLLRMLVVSGQPTRHRRRWRRGRSRLLRRIVVRELVLGRGGVGGVVGEQRRGEGRCRRGGLRRPGGIV
ncbi:hypothetical protein V1504DRAFT_448628 [Lipomyces starkeyi]